MHIPLFPTIPSDHQPHRQNTNHGFSCKRSRNTFRHCNRAMWHAVISFVANCMALTFNFPQRYWFFMTKQFGGNNYSIFMIAATVVRQPYKPAIGHNSHMAATLQQPYTMAAIYCTFFLICSFSSCHRYLLLLFVSISINS